MDDLAMARTLLRRLLVSRRGRIAVNRLLPEHPLPAPGTVDIAVYFADGPVNLYQLRQWYAPLAELATT